MKTQKSVFSFFITIAFAAVLSSCAPPPSVYMEESYQELSAADAYSGTGDGVFFIDSDGRSDLSYTLDLGPAERDVYFIFSNVGLMAQQKPFVESSLFSPDPSRRAVIDKTRPEVTDAAGRAFPDTPAIHAYNAKFRGVQGENPSAETDARPSILRTRAASGDTTGLYGVEDLGIPFSATCRAVVDRALDSLPVTLVVWVADDCWVDGGTKSLLVNQDQVDALAAKFLSASGADDIFHWLTNILGREWGAHAYENLIACDNQIDIFIYDIEGDDYDIVDNGGVLGAFYSRDNYTPATAPRSNGRVMFYIDSVLCYFDDAAWDIEDYWPSLIVSTLAHEFQHMIHFYQKSVLRSGSGSEIWLNEMASLLAEDLVADKLHIDGPRGVAFTDGMAGNPLNTAGRLPLYIYYNDSPLSTWLPWPATILNYSSAYAFGAYLGRNYGGAAFLRDLVQNGFTDFQAVEEAVRGARPDAAFPLILREWGAANLLSDRTAVTNPYLCYNAGGWFSSEQNGVTYNLGSIDLYKYRYAYENQTGPFIYANPSGVGGYPALNETSNTYFFAGRFSGSGSWRIKLDASVRLTVVVKE